MTQPDNSSSEPRIPDPPPFLNGGVGYAPGREGEVGVWVLHVRGGGAYLMNLAVVVHQLIAERPPGPAKGCLERLYEAIEESLEGVG